MAQNVSSPPLLLEMQWFWKLPKKFLKNLQCDSLKYRDKKKIKSEVGSLDPDLSDETWTHHQHEDQGSESESEKWWGRNSVEKYSAFFISEFLTSDGMRDDDGSLLFLLFIPPPPSWNKTSAGGSWRDCASPSSAHTGVRRRLGLPSRAAALVTRIIDRTGTFFWALQ